MATREDFHRFFKVRKSADVARIALVLEKKATLYKNEPVKLRKAIESLVEEMKCGVNRVFQDLDEPFKWYNETREDPPLGIWGEQT